MSAPTDHLLPFELRLLSLEARISGVPPYTSTSQSTEQEDGADPSSSAEAEPEPNTTLLGLASQSQSQSQAQVPRRSALRRLHDLHTTLERAGATDDGLKRFLANYDSYLPLLTIPGTATDTPTSAQTDPSAGSGMNASTNTHAASAQHHVVSPAALVPDSVKLTMLLEAAADVRALERDLRAVEVMHKRGVEGAGELETILPLRPALDAHARQSASRSAEVARAKRQVDALLTRYNQHNDTLTDLFLSLHHRLQSMEDKVDRAERRRRREAAERY